jgi:hypothetical protein
MFWLHEPFKRIEIHQDQGEIMKYNTLKTWLSPFVASLFAAVSLTGILMLFHLQVPGTHPIHKWGGPL